MDQRFLQLVRAGRGLLEIIGAGRRSLLFRLQRSPMSRTKSGDSECTGLSAAIILVVDLCKSFADGSGLY